jgi:hypothetical protein
LLGWFGFTLMVLLMAGAFAMSQVVNAIGHRLEPLAAIP